MEELLKISNLQVKREEKTILNLENEQIHLEKGDKVALLGKNGAGKTTLINCILGEIPYIGDVDKSFKWYDIGIVFQTNEYSDLIKVDELVSLVTHYKKRSNEIEKFYKSFELSKLSKKYVKNLSIGEQQRLTVGLVLSRKKEIYILDELTSGLDFEKREALAQLTKEVTEDSTVIQVTHYFEEIEDWANKVIILEKGSLIFFGNIDAYFRKYEHYSFLKVNKKHFSSVNLNKVYENAVLISNDGEIFTKDEKQHDRLINLFNESGLEVKTTFQNIYSTYLYSLKEKKYE